MAAGNVEAITAPVATLMIASGKLVPALYSAVPTKAGVLTLVTLGCDGRPVSSEASRAIVGATGVVVLTVTAIAMLKLLMLPARSCWTT